MIKARFSQRVKWAAQAFKNGLIQHPTMDKGHVFGYQRCEVIPVKLTAQFTLQNTAIIPMSFIRNRLADEIAQKIADTYPVIQKSEDTLLGTTVFTMQVSVIPPSKAT